MSLNAGFNPLSFGVFVRHLFDGCSLLRTQIPYWEYLWYKTYFCFWHLVLCWCGDNMKICPLHSYWWIWVFFTISTAITIYLLLRGGTAIKIYMRHSPIMQSLLILVLHNFLQLQISGGRSSEKYIGNCLIRWLVILTLCFVQFSYKTF